LVANVAFTIFGLWGRSWAKRNGLNTLSFNALILTPPVFMLFTKMKLDRQTWDQTGRKSLEDRLEYSPITRKAWKKAKEVNEQYQQELRNEIAELEAKLK